MTQVESTHPKPHYILIAIASFVIYFISAGLERMLTPENPTDFQDALGTIFPMLIVLGMCDWLTRKCEKSAKFISILTGSLFGIFGYTVFLAIF